MPSPTQNSALARDGTQRGAALCPRLVVGLVLTALLNACGGCSGDSERPAQPAPDLEPEPTPGGSEFSITTPTNNQQLGADEVDSVVVTGTCDEAGATIEITGAVAGSAPCLDQQWTLELDLSDTADGVVKLTASQSISVGTAPDPITVKVIKDTILPKVSLLLPTPDATLDPNTLSAVAVSGTCSENGRDVAVRANNGPSALSAACSKGRFSTVLDVSTLQIGELIITASLRDAAGNRAQASESVYKATVRVRANLTIEGFPHLVDYYIPSNAQAAVIFLHGGGSPKERLARDLGIKKNRKPNDYAVSPGGLAWLVDERVAMIVPQGQSVTEYAFTWNNYYMDSGQDDVAFLQALASSVRADDSLSGVTKLYLAGHSNGGMMANRMWCESPITFDAYGSLAGPPSIRLDPRFDASETQHPCNPAVVRPYLGIVGDSDSVLQTTGNMEAEYWVLAQELRNGPPEFVDLIPTVINETLFHAVRVDMKCGSPPAPPTASGQLTIYADCDDSVQTHVVTQTTSGAGPSGGEHCLLPSAICATSLAGESGLDYKTALMDFFRKF